MPESMGSTMGWRERRQEGRIPVDLPVTVMAQEGGEPLVGAVCDISRNGLKAKFPGAVPGSDGEEMRIAIAAQDREIEASGRIRWSREEADHFEVGLRLRRPVDLALPLPDVIEACNRMQETVPFGGFPWQQGLFQETLTTFFPYTFAGKFFWNLSDLIHSKHTYASGVTSLASFRIKRSLEVLEENRDRIAIDAAGLQKSMDDLEQVVSLLKNLSAVYRFVKDKFGPCPAEETALVDVSALVEQSVKDIQWVASQLNHESHLAIRCEKHPPALFCGPSHAISQCIDALTLFTFLNTRFGGGSNLQVSIESEPAGFRVRYANNASRMLSLERARIRPLMREDLAGVPPRDRNSLLWLHAGLVPLLRLGAEISVQSESGQNQIILKLPQPQNQKLDPTPMEGQPDQHRKDP